MENKTQDKYTSLEFSKKLKEAGCELESEKHWRCSCLGSSHIENSKEEPNQWSTKEHCDYYNAFDIMNDICVVHAKEFFGEESVLTGLYQQGYECNNWGKSIEYVESRNYAYIYHSKHILLLMQQGKKSEAELYIWNNTVFNPKNKVEE